MWWVMKEPKDTASNTISYEEVDGRSPYNWFTTNRIHCLRTRYVHKHKEPTHIAKPHSEAMFKIESEKLS